MEFTSKLDNLHSKVRQNRWMLFFSVFCRVSLAAGFIPSGMVKILGERFTALPDYHPMGAYLEALSHTGFYYPFIGVMQVLAAILLLIPRTAVMGAFLYLPLILNIFILTIAVRFDGSLLSSPLMLLANLYLLGWDFHKWKFILPFYHTKSKELIPSGNQDRDFPYGFFTASGLTVLAIAFSLFNGFDIMPRNSQKDCNQQCADTDNPQACAEFCACIHEDWKTLDDCLDQYRR